MDGIFGNRDLVSAATTAGDLRYEKMTEANKPYTEVDGAMSPTAQ
jgi:hypothetical protein